MQRYLALPAEWHSAPALTMRANHRQDLHHYQWVKPDLLARLISREGNQDRRGSLDFGIPGMRITLKTQRFTTSYTITP
jgi:hypothetical protein